MRRLARRVAGDAFVVAQPESTERVSYEHLYEAHAQAEGDDGVGNGDYDVVGEIEFDILRSEGLEPTSTLLDFGCGNGRLAIHVVPYLANGNYIGTDIAPTFLVHAARRIAAATGAAAGSSDQCSVRLVHQPDEHFDIADEVVDVACAFSVFTHMEHEDMFRYLVQLRRVVRSGGKVIVSCLPMTLDAARNIFLNEAAVDPQTRWRRVRNVTTSVELVDEIARLAGWTVVKWLPGTEGQAASVDGEMRSLGQSIVVLTHCTLRL